MFVKRHALAVRTVEALEEEHRFNRHLREQGVSVAVVRDSLAGPSAVTDQGWTWEVHELGAGQDRYRDIPSWQPFLSVADARATGVALARLAVAAGSYAAPARQPALLVSSWHIMSGPDLLDGIRTFASQRPHVSAALRRRSWERDVLAVLGPLHAQLHPQLDALGSGWTHGDGHPSNLLWSPAGAVTTVLDLGLADRTTPLLDLAIAIERSTISWLEPHPTARWDLIDALLDGWSSVRPLSGPETVALPELLALSHLDFALSELGYFDGITGSAANADLAYDYLIGHGRWWQGAVGAALRHRLRHRLRTL